MEQKTKAVGTRLTIEEIEELEDYCWVRRLKKSEVIRRAIKEYMARAKEREINLA